MAASWIDRPHLPIRSIQSGGETQMQVSAKGVDQVLLLSAKYKRKKKEGS